MVTLTADYLEDIGRVRLTASDLLDNVRYTLQRQTAIEPTWVNVRGGGNISTVGSTVIDDYEYTPNMVNTYRLIAPAFYDSFDRLVPAPIDEGFESLPLDVTITQGTPGDMRLEMPGTAGSRASTPSAAGIAITGDIDIRATIRPDDFAASEITIAGRFGAGQLSYQFYIVAGNLAFRGSTTGAATNITASTGTDLSTVMPYQRAWITVRVTRAAATGNIIFYYTFGSIDNAGPWTQLGATQVSTSGNLFAGTSPLWVGEDQAGSLDPFDGGIRQVQIRNGILGAIAANPIFSAQAAGTLAFNDSAGLPWSIVGAATITNAIQSSAAWTRTNTQAHTGSWSLRSGVILDNQVSDAVVTIPAGATTAQYWYRLDTEDGFDYLQVFKGTTLVSQVTGIIGWTQSAVIDVTGFTTLTFRYYKDRSTVGGADAAWIDDLTFSISSTTGTTWGTADTGQTYTVSDVDPNAYIYVNGSVGIIGDPNPVTDIAELHATTDPAAVDAEVTYSAIQPAASLDQDVEYDVGLRSTDALNYYESQLIFNDDYTVTIRIAKTIAGVYTGLTNITTVGEWQQNVPWLVRFRVQSSGLFMRAWEDGTVEPVNWQIFATDTSLATGSDIHIRARKNGGVAYEQWFGPIEVHAIPELEVASDSITPDQEEVWLKSVTYPLFNKELSCVDWDALNRSSRAGFFNIKGRHEILAITDVGSSASFGLTFTTSSRAENRAVVALLTFGGVLYLQPPGDSDEDCQFGTFSGTPGGYVVPTSYEQEHSVYGEPIWRWSIGFTRVAASDISGIVPTTITWEQLWAIIGPEGTWEDVWATWPTWQELWQTQGNITDFNGGVIG